ncbi:MarR family transcriptional regulator [Streptomyces sp. NPDC050738]|uniref:MarR family winged helix-turn-helix transcriptional regulator n=1 Tax=Streptomyces sp. NPDC050738 TaxID=3154744 RepID=UPI00342B6E39
MAEASGSDDGRGFELPLLMFAGFRVILDELHAELRREGHPDVRPAYGFALQAVGIGGATATEIGQRLGVSKQAAGKTVDRLEALGYVERGDDPNDGRRKVVRLSGRGIDVLVRSAAIFDRLHGEWARKLGADRLAEVEGALREAVPGDFFRLDAVSWFSG